MQPCRDTEHAGRIGIRRVLITITRELQRFRMPRPSNSPYLTLEWGIESLRALLSNVMSLGGQNGRIMGDIVKRDAIVWNVRVLSAIFRVDYLMGLLSSRRACITRWRAAGFGVPCVIHEYTIV